MFIFSALGLMISPSGGMNRWFTGSRRKGIAYWLGVVSCGFVIACSAPVQAGLQGDETEPQSEKQRENNTRRLIMREEQLFREMKTSATELERLAKIFAKRWEAAPANVKPAFTEDDREQLKQMEKLAKKIRSSQGAYGGDDDTPLPLVFREQVALLVKLADEVRQQADKARRQTLSVGILSRVGRIQRLVKAIRYASNS
jgi:hypothetical protein